MAGVVRSIYFWKEIESMLSNEFPYQWTDNDSNRSLLINNLVRYALENGYGVDIPMVINIRRMRDEFDSVIAVLFNKGIVDKEDLGTNLVKSLSQKQLIGKGV